MESRGNYYSAERHNKVGSKGEVKTESVSAREREDFTPERLFAAFLQTRRATGISNTDVHLALC